MAAAQTQGVKVMCCVAERLAAPVNRLVKSAGDLELVDVVSDATSAIVAMAQSDSDVLLLDAALPGLEEPDYWDRLFTFSGTPTMVFVDNPNAFADQYPNRRGLAVVDKALLESDELFKQKHILARLRTLVSRLPSRKSTITSRSLESTLREVRRSAAARAVADEVRQLAAEPLDLVTVVAGRGSAAAVEETLAGIKALPVPVLIAFEPGHAALDLATAAMRGGLDLTRFNQSIRLRNAHGLVLATGDRDIRVTLNRIESFPGPLDVRDLVGSMKSLGPHGLSVIFSSDQTALASALAQVVNEGGHAVVVRGAAGPNRVADTAEKWGVVERAFGVEELAWLLSHASPRTASGFGLKPSFGPD